MGKYTIEIHDAFVEDCGVKKLLLPVKLNECGSYYLPTGITLTPYTAPDLDAVRKEEYEKGVQDTKQHWVDAPRTCAYKLGYENGLNDLWEAMQKAIKMYCEIDNEVFLRVFYDVKCDWGESVLQALFKNTPQHLIDSIRKYEESKSKKKHTWIFSEVNEPSVDSTLICSECGYTVTIKPGDVQALNFCPKCGDNKNPGREKKNEDPA